MGSMDGEIGSLSVNIESDFKREGSKKEGASLGLEGMVIGEEVSPGKRDGGEEEEARSEGMCSRVKGGGPSLVSSDGRVIGEEEGFDSAISGATE